MLKSIFCSGNKKRDNYLSRVFGIWYEKVVMIWCDDPRSPFLNLGRPIFYVEENKKYRGDYLLEDSSGKRFVTEAKCEIAYQNYKFLTLDTSNHLEHHKKNSRTFRAILDMARETNKYTVTCNGLETEVDGTGLIWGRVSDKGLRETRADYKFHVILSIEDMIQQLNAWQNKEYIALLRELKEWTNDMFNGLSG